jgi:hypothetical protein
MEVKPEPLFLDRRGGRVRLALVLLLFTLFAVTGRFLEDSLVKQVRKDCGSLFADRLVPAALLVRLTDELHARYHTINRSLADDVAAGADLDFRLSESDARFDQLLGQYEKTYLVEDEAEHLHSFRRAFDDYRAREKVLAGERPGSVASDERRSYDQAFTNARSELQALTDVQLVVGAQLNEHSLRDTSGISALSYLQGGIAFVFGLIAAALAMGIGASRRQPASVTLPADPTLH